MHEATFLQVFFDPTVAWTYLPVLLQGAWVTISVSLGVIVTGLAGGLALALIRLVSPRWIVEILRLWVDCMRAVPPLAVIMLAYFGLPSLGIELSAFGVMWLTLACILAAFAEEIFWAGINAVERGQWEAARSTGMSQGQTLHRVVLPQAMRLCTPPLVNRTINITKNTALGAVIGMSELLGTAQSAQAFSGNATPLIMASLGYLLLFLPITLFADRLEKRMTWGRGA